MSVPIESKQTSHNINIRRSHAEFLGLLAEASGADLSAVCRALVDRSIPVPEGEQRLLEGVDLSSSKKALRMLQRQARERRRWKALDIVLRDDQEISLTERAQERRTSLSRVLRHIVAAYLDELCGGPQKKLDLAAEMDSLLLSFNFKLFFKGVAAALLVAVLAGGGWWVYENREKSPGSTEASGDIVIDSLEALEELERRNREAAKNQGN